MAEDEFNELWMFKDKKASMAAYRNIHPCQYVYKHPDSNLTKFLISLGERINPRKSTSLDPEDTGDKKEIQTSPPPDHGSPLRVSPKKSSIESRRLSNTVKSNADFKKHSVTKKSTDDVRWISGTKKQSGDSIVGQKRLSSESRKATAARKPHDRRFHSVKRRSFDAARISELECKPIEEIYKHIKERSPKRCASPGRGIHSPRKSISPIDKSSVPAKLGSPGRDSKEGSPVKIASPRGSWCPSGKTESPRKGSRSPTGTVSTRSRSLSLTDDISRYYHRRRKLVGSMPGLDEFESLESIDFSIAELRFADPNIHTVFENVQPTIKDVKESVVPQQHDFKLKVVQLKHDTKKNVYFGVIDSSEEVTEESDEETIATENENAIASDSSNEDQCPNHYYYKKFNIPPYKKKLFIAENHYSEWLKEQSIRNYRKMFGIKEKLHCKYDVEHNLEEKRKEMMTKHKQINQSEGYMNIRNEHDLKYKYVPMLARCDRIAGPDLDELYLAELTLALREAQKAALRGQGGKRETLKQRKILAKLMKIFQYETDAPILPTSDTTDVKPKPKKKRNQKFEAKQEALKAFKEQIHNYLFNRIYAEGFDDFYEAELKKRDVGVVMDPDEKFSYSSLLYEPHSDEPKRYHSYLYRRLIVNRDFSNVPPKTIKGLENLGILYESTLYDPPKEGMYKAKPIPDVKKDLEMVPIMKANPKKKVTKSKLINLQPNTSNINNILSPQQSKKKKTPGLRSHRDSLKKKQKPKKSKTDRGDKDGDVRSINLSKSDRSIETVKPSESVDKTNLEMLENKANVKGSIDKATTPGPRKSLKHTPSTMKKPLSEKDRQDLAGSEDMSKLKSVLKGSLSPDKKLSLIKGKNKSVDGLVGLSVDVGRSEKLKQLEKLKAQIQEYKSPIIIEFDPIANGAITKSMEQFSTYYNTPLHEISRLADGVILIEPDDKKNEARQRKSNIAKRQNEEALFPKTSPMKSDESVSAKKSNINKD